MDALVSKIAIALAGEYYVATEAAIDMILTSISVAAVNRSFMGCMRNLLTNEATRDRFSLSLIEGDLNSARLQLLNELKEEELPLVFHQLERLNGFPNDQVIVRWALTTLGNRSGKYL